MKIIKERIYVEINHENSPSTLNENIGRMMKLNVEIVNKNKDFRLYQQANKKECILYYCSVSIEDKIIDEAEFYSLPVYWVPPDQAIELFNKISNNVLPNEIIHSLNLSFKNLDDATYYVSSFGYNDRYVSEEEMIDARLRGSPRLSPPRRKLHNAGAHGFITDDE